MKPVKQANTAACLWSARAASLAEHQRQTQQGLPVIAGPCGQFHAFDNAVDLMGALQQTLQLRVFELRQYPLEQTFFQTPDPLLKTWGNGRPATTASFTRFKLRMSSAKV